MAEQIMNHVYGKGKNVRLIAHDEGLWTVLIKFRNYPIRTIHNVCYREAFFFIKYLDDLDFTFVHDYICNTK